MARRHFFFQRNSTGAPLTGGAGAMSAVGCYYDGTPKVIPTIAELDGTNAPGWYYFALDIAATDGRLLVTIDAGAGVTDAQFRYNELEIQPNVYQLEGLPAKTADDVWDEVASGHTTVGTTGAYLDYASTLPEAATTAAAVWDEAAAGHVAAGSMGEIMDYAATLPDAATTAGAVLDESLVAHQGAGSLGLHLTTLAALTFRHYRILSVTYSGTPARATSQTIALYPTKADADADINRIDTLTATHTYDSLGRITASKIVGT